MQLQVEKVGAVTIVDVKAESLDATNDRDFKDQMNALLPSVRSLLLGLQQVQFINSAGLAALLMCLKQLRAAGGDMKVCGVTTPVKALFELVRMNRIMEVCKTREDALKAFAKTA